MLIEEFSDVKVASQRTPSNSNVQSVMQSMCNQAKQYSFLPNILGHSCKHFHPRILGKKFKLACVKNQAAV